MSLRGAAPKEKKKVAAIVTEYRYYSHADVIVGRLLEGYYPNNARQEPRTELVAMYTDQVPKNDMSRDLARKHGFKIHPTVAEALTLGGSKLAVDAVLLIGEHGDYPVNDRGQKLYPRYELFQKIVEVFQASGRSVPVFSDKHLSYSWEKADAMYRQARRMRFPLMAGSSIPLTVRVPELELPYNCRLENALSVGYGDLDAYGFHTLETLQCMVERRRGGEKGLKAVEWLEGDAVWKWRDGEGAWSAPLLEAALAANPNTKHGPPEKNARRPALFLLEYRDGLRAASYMLEGHQSGFLFAGRLQGAAKPVAAHFGFATKARPLPHFDGLVRSIEEFFVSGKPVYPVERTLLTTGALAFLFESRARRQRLATSELAVTYRAPRDTWFQRS